MIQDISFKCNVQKCCNNDNSIKQLCFLCRNPEYVDVVYRDLLEQPVKFNRSSNYLFKVKPSFNFVSNFLQSVCENNSDGFYFNKVSFKRLQFMKKIPFFQQQLYLFYHRKYFKYIENMDSFIGFNAVIKHLCTAFNIIIIKKKKKICNIIDIQNYIKLEEKLELLMNI